MPAAATATGSTNTSNVAVDAAAACGDTIPGEEHAESHDRHDRNGGPFVRRHRRSQGDQAAADQPEQDVGEQAGPRTARELHEEQARRTQPNAPKRLTSGSEKSAWVRPNTAGITMAARTDRLMARKPGSLCQTHWQRAPMTEVAHREERRGVGSSHPRCRLHMRPTTIAHREVKLPRSDGGWNRVTGDAPDCRIAWWHY